MKGAKRHQNDSVTLSAPLWAESLGVISSARGAETSHLGSERHSFPRATAAFLCTPALLGSAAAWRSRSSTISVPSRRLAVPCNSRQCARHSAALPDTISSQLGASRRRSTDSSVHTNRGRDLKKKKKLPPKCMLTHTIIV